MVSIVAAVVFDEIAGVMIVDVVDVCCKAVAVMVLSYMYSLDAAVELLHAISTSE